MGQLNTIGWVSSELVEGISANQIPFIRFSLAEQVGYGSSARTQYYQVWAWSDLMRRLVKAKVRKGSLLWVSGSLEQDEYTKKDGVTRDKRLVLTLTDWNFVPSTGKHGSRPSQTQDAHQASAANTSPVDTIDGERNTLPE